MNTCSKNRCIKSVVAKGLCSGHYKKQNTPTGKKYAPRGTTLGEKLVWTGWDEDTATGCWITRYTKDENGYGIMAVRLPDKRHTSIRTHRVSYEHFVGPIPTGQVVRHACDNPPCVNPGHLELGTQKQNIDDMYSRGRGGSRTRKVTPEIAQQIKELLREGALTQKQIAQKFGVSPSHISNIKAGRTHKEA